MDRRAPARRGARRLRAGRGRDRADLRRRRPLADPQLAALGSIATVDDVLGPLRMPNVVSRLSETPGEIRHAGRGHGADTDAVLAELGVAPDELERLRAEGAV